MAIYEHSDQTGISFFYPLVTCFVLGFYLVYNRHQTILNRAIPFRHTPPDKIAGPFQSIKIPEPSLTAHTQYEEFQLPMHDDSKKYITAFDPATGYHLETIEADSTDDIITKIHKAAEAQKEWKKSSFVQRRRVIRSLKKWLVDNQEICAKVACRDTGKTMLDAALGEILTTCSKMDYLFNHGERVLRPESRTNPLLMFYKSSQVHYEPLGVVAAIVSWNYPLHNAWSPILAALFAGDAIVVKCSEQVIWSTRWFIDAIHLCLQACGYSRDLVQLVCCYPEDAEALTMSPLIKHITFIGSEQVGKIIAKAAAENLTPVTLELGGKDPAIILPSTDLSKWSSIWMRGVYQNSGQNCIGIERLIVHRSQYAELYQMFCERANNLTQGPSLPGPNAEAVAPVDCGAMISADRFTDLERMIRDAHESGAELDVGGEPFEHTYVEKGFYFKPTVVGNVDPESEIAQRELFAPVALIMQYDTVNEAIQIANGTRYGLGASVFGPDQEQCMQVAKELECGMVSINDFGVFYLNQDLPFGGAKASGYGRFGGPEGLRSLTNPKVIVVDRWGWLIQTSIPKALDYPIESAVRSWRFVSGLIGVLYADSWRSRIDYLMQLVGK